MTDRAALAAWMQKYRRAWESNEADDIRALFADDAVYRTEPYSDPWLGVDEIVGEWMANGDQPGETEFEWTPVALDDGTAIVEGTTVYREGPRYRNLWVVKLTADGRASSFTEWWMEIPEEDDDER